MSARPELVAQMRLLREMVAADIGRKPTGAYESFMVRAGLLAEILDFALAASADRSTEDTPS